MSCISLFRHSEFVAISDDLSEVGAPPAPGAVDDDVGRAGVEWSVMCVELARVVSGTAVVRVADRRQRTVGQTFDTTIHLESARHFVDHLVSDAWKPFPV